MWCAGVLGALARVSLDVREVDGFGFDRGGVPEEFDDQPASQPAMRCCDESFAGTGDASLSFPTPSHRSLTIKIASHILWNV